MTTTPLIQGLSGWSAGYLYNRTDQDRREILQGKNEILASVKTGFLINRTIGICSPAIQYIPFWSLRVTTNLLLNAFTLVSIPFAIFCSVVKENEYEHLTTGVKNWFKIELPSLSERSIANFKYINDHLSQMTLVASAVAATVLVTFGQYYFAASLAGSFIYSYLARMNVMGFRVKLLAEAYLPIAAFAIQAFAPGISLPIRVLAFGELLLSNARFARYVQGSVDRLIQERFLPWASQKSERMKHIFENFTEGPSLVDGDTPLIQPRQLTLEEMTAICSAPEDAFEVNPRHCAQKMAERSLPQDLDFDCFLPLFDNPTLDWEAQYRLIKKKALQNSDHFRDLLIERFNISKDDVTDAITRDQWETEKLPAINLKRRRDGLPEIHPQVFQGYLPEILKLDRIMRVYADDLRTKSSEIDNAQLQILNIGFEIAYLGKFRWNNLDDFLVDEMANQTIFLQRLLAGWKRSPDGTIINTQLSPTVLKTSLEEMIDVFAKEKEQTHPAFMKAWLREQLDVLAGVLRGKLGRPVEGKAEDLHIAVKNYAQVVHHLKGLQFPRDRLEITDILLQLGTEGGQYCALALKENAEDMVKAILPQEPDQSQVINFEEKFLTFLQNERKRTVDDGYSMMQMVPVLPSSLTRDKHTYDFVSPSLALGFAPISPERRYHFDFVSLVLWEIARPLRQLATASYHQFLLTGTPIASHSWGRGRPQKLLGKDAIDVLGNQPLYEAFFQKLMNENSKLTSKQREHILRTRRARLYAANRPQTPIEAPYHRLTMYMMGILRFKSTLHELFASKRPQVTLIDAPPQDEPEEAPFLDGTAMQVELERQRAALRAQAKVATAAAP